MSKSQSHIVSFTAAVRAMYSDWHINSEIVTYSFNFHEIGPLFNVNIKPNTEHLMVLSRPQSASLKPISIKSKFLLPL